MKKIKRKILKDNLQELNATWLNNYGDMKTSINYPDISLYSLMEETANNYPNNYAYNYFGTKVTYKKMLKQIEDCAKSFKSMGIKAGDRITICMPNTPEAIIAFYAINKIGAIANMIHPLSSENEIKYYLQISESIAIIAIDMVWSKVEKIIDETKVEKTILVSVNDSMPRLMSAGYFLTKGYKVKFPKPSDSIIYWKDFIENGKAYIQETNVYCSKNAPAVILYSGGTTGKPKGIILSNLNFNAVALQCLEFVPTLQAGDSCLSIMPIFHGFGLGVCIHTVFCRGVTAIILPQFDNKKFYNLIDKYKPNILVGVPTLYESLLKTCENKNVNLSFVKAAICGGDSLSINLKHRVDELLKNSGSVVQIRQGYGMTECSSATCLTPPYKNKDGSIGIPLPDVYYKIVNPSTHIELPNGTTGEICISGPNIMLGYLNEPKETAHTLQMHEDGRIWLHTGDLGYIDEEGWVFFQQRLKRMIVSSGYNIYPQQIEEVIDSHPDVLTSTVIGISHPYKVQVAKAYIVLKPGVEPSKDVKNSIYNLCEKNISKYAMPYEFEYRTELPKTLIGKVAYRELENENKKESSD